MKQMLIDLEQKDSAIKLLKEKYVKSENLVNENQISDLKKDLEIRNAQLNGLDMRIEELEKRSSNPKERTGKEE